MNLKRVAVLGEIGAGNLGDDFGYVLLRDALQAALGRLDVLADVRPVTPNLFGLLDSYHWDAVVTGCGTLLDLAEGVYVRALRSARCPVAVLGTGVADPRHIGPTEGGKRALKELLKRCNSVWLRADPDGSHAAQASPDPGWLYGWHDRGAAEGLGINVGYAAFSTMCLDPMLLANLQIVRNITTYPSSLVAAWKSDLVWLQRLQHNGEPIAVVTGTRESTQVLDRLHVLLATRVHLAVVAACHGVFPILPDYANKTKEVFSGTSVPHLIVSANPSVDELLTAIHAAPQVSVSAPAVQLAQAAAQARVEAAATALLSAWRS